MKKRVADIVMDVLVENGITDCFTVVGGGAMHLDNALVLCNDINKVFNHHEQACSMAAEGYAKACGKMAAVCVTSGPGALNTLNGVEGAYVDNVPMIIIAGHPRWNTTVNASGLNLRYRGVQEYDIIPSVKGMTKYANMVVDPLSIKREVQKAIDIANEGRKGPSWLSIPLDVQSHLVETEDLYPIVNIEKPNYNFDNSKIKKLNKLIHEAARPVILAGSGIRTGDAIEEFRSWVTYMGIPVVSGALLPDIMCEGTPLFYGTSGSVGERRGNFILQNSDLIIAIGNSLALKQTGFNQEAFAPKATIVMVDAGEDEFKKPGTRVDVAIFCDAKTFITTAKEKINPWTRNDKWIEYCDSILNVLGDIDDIPECKHSERVPNGLFWKYLNKSMPDNTMVALGNSSSVVGRLQHSIRKPNQRVIVNYNSGSMGDDLPEALGMCVSGAKEVICVTGDGSIMMNLQELQTIRYHNYNIKIVIFSNEGYGAIRQTNKAFFDGLYVGCDENSGISLPDFSKIAAAFEMPYLKCKNVGQIEESVNWILNNDGPVILEIEQRIDDPVLPKVMSKMNEDGSFFTPPLHDMYPLLSDEQMARLMVPSDG